MANHRYPLASKNTHIMMEFHSPAKVTHVFHGNSPYDGWAAVPDGSTTILSGFKHVLVFHHGTPFPFKKKYPTRNHCLISILDLVSLTFSILTSDGNLLVQFPILRYGLNPLFRRRKPHPRDILKHMSQSWCPHEQQNNTKFEFIAPKYRM